MNLENIMKSFQKIINILLIAILFTGLALSTASQPVYAGDQYQKYEPNSATPPTDYVPAPSNSNHNQAGQSIAAPNALGSLVAVFTLCTLVFISTEDMMIFNVCPFEMHTSMEFSTIDFNQFPMIVIAGDQPQAFYDRYATYQSKFENYVIAGGYLNFFACDMGWNGKNYTVLSPALLFPVINMIQLTILLILRTPL